MVAGLRRGVLAVLLVPRLLFATNRDRTELEALREQVQQLEAQLRTISRQLEIREAAAKSVNAPASRPVESSTAVPAAKSGYMVEGANSGDVIRLRALLQVDSRTFLDDGEEHDTFLLRRARLATEGTIGKGYGYQFVTEFAGSSVSILDANLTVRALDSFQFKVGKFKTPVGLEVLQSVADLTFVERSPVSGLLPGRDVGGQVSGGFGGDRVNVAIGVFNGVADGGHSTNADFDGGKEVAARVLLRPVKRRAGTRGGDLAVGLGGSVGPRDSVLGRSAGYRTSGQQVYFTYAPAVTAAGETARISPQFDYRGGPFGLMGEYVISRARLRAAADGPVRELRHHGWHLATSYVLTGEASTYGTLVPRNDFSPADGTWGAFELMARWAAVDIDGDAFPAFASAAVSAAGIDTRALGLKWYLSKAVVFKFDYLRSSFERNGASREIAVAPSLQQPEKVFVTRFQLAF